MHANFLQKGVNSDESLSPYDKVKVVWNWYNQGPNSLFISFIEYTNVQGGTKSSPHALRELPDVLVFL